MTGKRCRTTTTIDKRPTFGHGHRIGMSAADVVMSRMCFVGEHVEEDGLLGVVVVKRGRCG